jgi:hypothetical protein
VSFDLKWETNTTVGTIPRETNTTVGTIPRETNTTVGTIPKTNRIIVKNRSKIDTPNTHIIHNYSLLVLYRHFNKKWRG